MELVDFKEWKYGKDGRQLIVKPPETETLPIPETVFKYYSLNENGLEVLEQNKVFAPHPKLLNDPFDCYHELISFDDPESIKTFLGPTLEEPEIKEQFEKDPESLRPFVEYNFRVILFNRLGIFSVTERPNHLLMWSYYNSHKGFCIEFDYRKFPFRYHGPFQMKYTREFDPMSISFGGHNCMLYLTTVKSDDWKHEKEWRILLEREGNKPMETKEIDSIKDIDNTTDRKFDLSDESFKRVILGNKFFDNDNELFPKGDELIVSMKKDIENKNRLLRSLERLNVPVELVFRDRKKFTFESVPIEIVRISESELKIKKTLANKV